MDRMTFEQRVNEELAQSVDWLRHQRWFGDKARTLQSVRAEVAAVVKLDSDQAVLLIVRCQFETGEDARYFVPVVGLLDPDTAGDSEPQLDSVRIRDALSDTSFLSWFLAGFQDGRTGEDTGTWRWHVEPGSKRDLALIDVENTRILDVEQSNTSILFDHRVMAKIFRRLQSGINPDLEVTEYVTSVQNFAHVPKLFGTFDLDFQGEHIVLGALQQFVSNVGDGWSWLLDELRRLSPDRLPQLAEEIGLLGRRTGELHVVLGAETDNEAFSPQPMIQQHADALQARVLDELRETIEGLKQDGRHSDDELKHLDARLRERIGAASALVGTLQIRIHGDYHLGQVLRTLEDDFAIIDFEGEPSRTIEQRRQKASPLRDVAGMLRSLDYAIGAIRGEVQNPEHNELVRQWGELARTRFVDNYREALKTGDSRLIPDGDDFAAGLHVLEIEKALYETRYELNNRPDWLEIPARALAQLAGA